MSGDRSMVYLDSSALVKLVVAEAESAALRRYLRGRPERVSSVLAKVEVIRAVRPQGAPAVARARQVLRRVNMLHLDDELLEYAATLDIGVLRSLDAVHLAAARTLGDELQAVVTYDDRIAGKAARLGLQVDMPRP